MFSKPSISKLHGSIIAFVLYTGINTILWYRPSIHSMRGPVEYYILQHEMYILFKYIPYTYFIIALYYKKYNKITVLSCAFPTTFVHYIICTNTDSQYSFDGQHYVRSKYSKKHYVESTHSKTLKTIFYYNFYYYYYYC